MALHPQEPSVAQPGATSTNGERAAPARRFRIIRVVIAIIRVVIAIIRGALGLILTIIGICVGALIIYVGALAGYALGAMIGGASEVTPFEGGGSAGIVGAIIGGIVVVGLVILGGFTRRYLDD